MTETVTLLPAPMTDRWRPTRAGIVALWRYWDETFTFHHGRLLLRGPNGSGKSMALELLLPFLLDADASPTRLTSAARSRGGLFERVMTGTDEPSRTGFAWVEFRRGDVAFTAGVRLRASTATRKVDADFVTTSQEVGVDLHLLDAQRVPLTRKALIEAIDDAGRVHTSGEEHRAAVRATLFPGFGADRYASVITALLALRKEKLSQNLDLDKLSAVLSDALPSIDDHDLAAVAEGFERLDRRRSEFDALETELGEVEALEARQRDYARAVLASVAREVRSAATRRDDVTRAEREAHRDLDTAQAESTAITDALSRLDERLAAIDVEIDALKASDAYRDGADLDDLRSETTRLRKLVERDEQLARRRTAERADAVAVLDEAECERDAAHANHELADADLRQAGALAGSDAALGEAAAMAEPDDAERVVHAWVRARRAQIAEVRTAVGSHGSAMQQRAFLERGLADDEAAVERESSALDQAVASHDAAVDDYAAEVAAWVGSCHAVGVERVVAAVPQPSADPAVVAQAVSRLAADLQSERAVAQRELTIRRAGVEDERHVLTREREPLAGGRLPEPPAPPWRGSRQARPGAPLWQLIDVPEGADTENADHIEAALTAAGLLDAWVMPDGALDVGDPTADLTLTARRVAGATLADFLVPVEGADVDASIVAEVLASIPVAASVTGASPDGSPDVVVGLDGTFQLGAAFGQGAVRPSELLGATARERHRLARLAVLDAAISQADARVGEIDREAEDIDRQQAAVATDLDALPTGAAVGEADRDVAHAEARLAVAHDRVAGTRRAIEEAEEEVRSALRTLTTLAARHRLPTNEEGLGSVDGVLTDLERAATTWARRARELVGTERVFQRALAEVGRAEAAEAEATANHAASESDAVAVEGRLVALESAIGAEYRLVIDRIGALDDERQTGRTEHRELSETRPEVERRIGKLEAAVAEAAEARTRADEDRAHAHRRFARVIADGLGADSGVALPEELDNATAALSAARSIAADLDGAVMGPSSIERSSERVNERLHLTQGAIGARVDLAREFTDDGWWLLRASVSGMRRSVAELSSALAGQLAEGRAELAADEERLFEQTLAGSVRRALAERIRQANALVESINDQLGTVRTAAAGVEIRLRWEVDPEQLDAVKAARSLLLRDPADLSDDERVALQEFVRARVDQARAELEANAPWEARLRETLDYRAWHRFTLQIGHRDWDGFQPATARRLQRLSTGERSIALHLPMLASIAAHYAADDGTPSECPRLILLDELFAGVDTANRAQLFGTFTAWDLDAVFTSDQEWCQYATLDGIAIHVLHPATADEPVTSTRFTWDGRHRSIDPSAA